MSLVLGHQIHSFIKRTATLCKLSSFHTQVASDLFLRDTVSEVPEKTGCSKSSTACCCFYSAPALNCCYRVLAFSLKPLLADWIENVGFCLTLIIPEVWLLWSIIFWNWSEVLAPFSNALANFIVLSRFSLANQLTLYFNITNPSDE